MGSSGIKQKLSQVLAANAALEDDLKVSRGEIERLVKSLEEKKVDGTTVEKLLCEINSMKETEIENLRIIRNFEEQVKKLFNDSELQTNTIALLKSEHAEAEMQLKLKLLENEQLKAKFTDSQQANTDDLENQRKLMDSRTKELNEKIVSLHQELSDAKEIELKAAELEKEVERLKFDLQESERVCEIVDTECNRLESELEETKDKLTEKLATSLQSTMIAGQHTVMDDISIDCTLIPSVYEKYRKLEAYKSELEMEVNQLRQRIDGMASKEAEHNLKTQLVKEKEHATRISEENCSLKENIKSLEKKAADKMCELEQQLARVKEEVGIKNIEFASLKVDVEKGELEFKKKSEILQADLDYEKTNNARLTQQLRRLQSSAMDTTLVDKKTNPKVKENETCGSSTSAPAAGSPVWSSGSGAIKEIRLHEAEMKVKSLERENSKLREHEEFYINKAGEWKNRALRYERTMEQSGLPFKRKEGGVKKSEAPQETANEMIVEDAENSKKYQAAGFSPRKSVNPLQDLHNLQAERNACPVPPTEDIKLVLSTRSQVQRTEEDFKLPESSLKNQNECPTQ